MSTKPLFSFRLFYLENWSVSRFTTQCVSEDVFMFFCKIKLIFKNTFQQLHHYIELRSLNVQMLLFLENFSTLGNTCTVLLIYSSESTLVKIWFWCVISVKVEALLQWVQQFKLIFTANWKAIRTGFTCKSKYRVEKRRLFSPPNDHNFH